MLVRYAPIVHNARVYCCWRIDTLETHLMSIGATYVLHNARDSEFEIHPPHTLNTHAQ